MYLSIPQWLGIEVLLLKTYIFSRSRLADTIPDKYHLSRSDVKCLLCGVQKAIHEVLRNNMAGAHLVFITRGSPDTLSISDEQTIQEYIKYYHIRVSSIIVPENEKLPLAFYDSVSQMSGGTSRIISREYSDAQASVRVYVDLVIDKIYSKQICVLWFIMHLS